MPPPAERASALVPAELRGNKRKKRADNWRPIRKDGATVKFKPDHGRKHLEREREKHAASTRSQRADRFYAK